MTPPARQQRHGEARSSAGRRRRPLRLRRVLLLSGLGMTIILALFFIFSLPDFFVLRARMCLEERRHAAALYWLEKAAWLSPDRPEVNFLLARTHRRLRHFDDVERYLRRAHDLGWNVWELEREQLIALAQDGQFEEVEAHWGMLLTNAGSDGPEISAAYVDDRLSRFNLDEALLVLDAWQRDFPRDAEPHFKRGRILEVMEQWKDAGDEYHRAVQLDAGRFDARYLLATMLMRQMFFEEAAGQLRICLAHDPQDGDASVALAKCLNGLARPDEARRILEAQLERDPNHLAALRERGEMELAVGNAAAAIGFLRRALDQEPVDREIHYSLAQALQRAGRRAEAQKEFAFVHEATKPVLRLATVTPALAKDPANVELRFEVAMTTWKYKSRREGAKWLLSLLQFDPHHAPTHRVLAEHYTLLGDHRRAQHHSELARQYGQAEGSPAAP